MPASKIVNKNQRKHTLRRPKKEWERGMTAQCNRFGVRLCKQMSSYAGLQTNTHAQNNWPLAHGHCRCISTSGICWSRRLKSVQRSRTFSAFGAVHGSVRVYFITRHGCHKILHLCPPRSFVKASTKITLGFPIRCAPRQPTKKTIPQACPFYEL